MSHTLRIGTRGSALALWQANAVAEALRVAHPGLEVEIIHISTHGDQVQNVPLSQMGGKGLFTVELERALATEEVDVCVHSMKDVQTIVPEGLCIAAMLPRADVRDVLVSKGGIGFFELAPGAKVGTGSLRRRAQLMVLRQDLDYVELRGNLDTRIRKATEGELDACVLASAGITRMGWSDCITGYFPPEQILPAVGQGAVGMEARSDDAATLDYLAAISDAATMRCVATERLVMRSLEGGCQAPLGALATIKDGALSLTAMVASLDGTQVIRRKVEGTADPAGDELVAQTLVDLMEAAGARELLAAAREQTEAAAKARVEAALASKAAKAAEEQTEEEGSR